MMSQFNCNSNLKIYYQNCNGVKSKLQELRRSTLECDYDMIFLTESKLQSDFMSSELCPAGSVFNVHRKDRDLLATGKLGGGGCLALTRKLLKVERAQECETITSNEELWLKMEHSNGRLMYFCLIYLRPCSTLEEVNDFFEHVLSKMQTFNDKTNVMIVGDFNLPSIRWQIIDGILTPCDYEG